MKEISITANDAGQRLDKYLRKYLPEAGSGFLYKMLRKKNITLNGKKAFNEFQTHLPMWKVVPLELSLLRHSILTRMRYEYADKKDFISHKV